MSDDAVRGSADPSQQPPEDISGQPGAPVPTDAEGPLDVEPPWGVGEDSPMNEGSEPIAVPEGQRGERRAGEGAEADDGHGPSLGPTEPIEVPEAGPGGPHEPSPPRRSFPHEDDVT
jgi:hypothetical protein